MTDTVGGSVQTSHSFLRPSGTRIPRVGTVLRLYGWTAHVRPPVAVWDGGHGPPCPSAQTAEGLLIRVRPPGKVQG